MDFLGYVLATSGTTAILLTVAGYLGRSQLKHWFSKDLERERNELATRLERTRTELAGELEGAKAKLAAQLEGVKADLQKVNSEHAVRFTSLHAKRAEVVAELYALLVEGLWAAEDFLAVLEYAGEPPKSEKMKTALDALVRAYRYFDKHRVFLPENVCDSIEKLSKDTRQLMIKFGVHLRSDESTMPDHAIRNKLEAWTKGYESITTEIPKARRLLERELRILLGEVPDEALPAEAAP